jgi:menaquinone-dependent protoporphyrinogen IX oxidase
MFKDKEGDYKLKIAFDYDDTLTEPLLFKLAQHLISKGHDVWIMTARSNFEQYAERFKRVNLAMPITEAFFNAEYHKDLFETAKQLKIEDKIIFTNLADKKTYFDKYQFDILFDDDAKWHCNEICKTGGIAINV